MRLVETLMATGPWVAPTDDLPTRTTTGIDVTGAAKPGKRRLVDLAPVALPDWRLPAAIGNETKPVKVLEDGVFVFRTAANAVVVFEPEQHRRSNRAGHAPDVDRVSHMAKMEIPGRRWRKTCDERSVRGCPAGKIQATHAYCES